MLVDKSKSETDNSHAYFQLPNKVNCRYLKINNIQVPSGNFAISGFRVFGKGFGNVPEKVSNLKAIRNKEDKRSVTLTWDKSKGANGYNISYGVDKDHLYQNYIVYGNNSVTINSLNTNCHYFFTIEAFNENGITKSEKVVAAE